MKLTISTIILCCFCAFGAMAQTNYSIKGSTGDAGSGVKLPGATIMVVNQKDSIMRAFTWAGNAGEFSIKNLPKGKFLILMTYPGYADYVDRFVLDSANTSHDFGYIDMVLKTKLLKDVIIKGQVDAIKIKGDTMEYNAKAFKVQPNASVEDLIKQFPGFQVDKDGKITAHGKTVQKVLVDGEEFFGDDPTLVTRNLRADMVDKAQLYEKKSDQAAFTGVDDGKTTTTLNLKLKQDKKNGLFGKMNGNIGTDGYYEGQLQFNRFKANEKFAVYGTSANDGRTGLEYGDASSLGVGNDNVQFGDDGSMMFFSGGGDALDSFGGYYNGQGKPQATSGGVHYDSKWDGDKKSINGNYKIGQIDVNGITSSTTEQAFLTGTNVSSSNQNFNDFAFRQKLDFAYQYKLDTATTLKFTASGTQKTFHVINDVTSKEDSIPKGLSQAIRLNDNSRNVDNHGDERIFNASALYTKKFKKDGRTLSWFINEAYDDKKTNGYLKSTTDYYKNGLLDSTAVINQYKPTNTVTQSLRSNITYSEPLSKRLKLLFNYAIGVNNASSDNQSFDQSTPGVYDVLDKQYSSDYKFNQLDNQVGAILNYKYKKAIFNFGTKVSTDNYKQVDEYSGNEVSRNFINWYPQAMFQYRPGPQEILMINYNGSTQQPSLQQLQPLLSNSDPLNVTLGNPQLKPSFNNNIYGWFSNYKVISGFDFNVNAGYSNTINPIVNNTVTSAGKNTTQYVNLPGETPWNYYSYINLGEKIKAIDTYVGIRGNSGGNVSYSYSDGALDKGTSYSYGGSLVLQKYKEKKYDFSVSAGPSYTLSRTTFLGNNITQPNVNNNAGGFNSNGYASVYLPLKFVIGSDINYNYTAKTAAFQAQYKTIWNAYVYKTFLKDDKLKISASVNDLLDQNNNFSRGIYGNTYTQTTTTGIRRFFMLSVVWNFTKFNTSKTQDDKTQDDKATK